MVLLTRLKGTSDRKCSVSKQYQIKNKYSDKFIISIHLNKIFKMNRISKIDFCSVKRFRRLGGLEREMLNVAKGKGGDNV